MDSQDIKNVTDVTEKAAAAAPAAAPAQEGALAEAKADDNTAHDTAAEGAEEVQKKRVFKPYTPPPGSRAAHIKEALELLYDKFPKAFIREGDLKPLKVGILDDLKKLVPEIDGMTTSKLRAAVRLYCTRLRYLFSVREGAARIDLDGNEVEQVSAEHAAYAKERFAELNEIRKKKREERAKQAEKQAVHGDGQGRKPFNKNFKGGRKPFNKNFKGGPRQGGYNNGGYNNNRNFNRDRADGQGVPRRFNNNRGPMRTPNGDMDMAPRMRRPAVRTAAPAQVRRTGVGTRSLGTPATEADLKVGTTVLVNSNNHYMRGTVSAAPEQGSVRVQLTSGITMSLPVDKVLLPNSRPTVNRS